MHTLVVSPLACGKSFCLWKVCEHAHAMLLRNRTMLQFRRITTQRGFIPQIDGLRFVAIASVVFFHIYAALTGESIPTRADIRIS